MRQYCDGSVSPSKIKMVRRSIVYRKILLVMYHPLVYLQETNGLVVKASRRVVEDALQGPLDDAARSQYTLAQFHQTLTNLQRRHTACVSQLNVTVIYWTPPSYSLSVERMHRKKPTYLGSKYIIPVMDEDPSHPPAGDQPAFGQATAGEDWNITAERCHGWTTATWEDLERQQQQQEDEIRSGGKIIHGSPVC